MSNDVTGIDGTAAGVVLCMILVVASDLKQVVAAVKWLSQLAMAVVEGIMSNFRK